MAGLDRKKSGTNQTSWEYYISQNPEWLEKPLRTDTIGDLFGPDGSTSAYRFAKGEECQILDLNLHRIGTKDLAKVRINGIVGWTHIKNISKPTSMRATTAGGVRYQERQEIAVIDAINDAVAANGGKPITVTGANNTAIKNVTGARKNDGLNAYRKEKYADMILSTVTGEFGVSMKMEKAPSLLGGGYEALYDMDPGFISRLMNRALDQAIRSGDFELGSNKKLKDIFIEIKNPRFLKAALIGTVKMGGPIEYMFIGKDIPKFEKKGGVLKFTDSSFYTISQYQQKIPPFYFRIRRRNAQQIFTNEKDNKGLPLFFRNPTGRERGRIVVDSTVPSTAFLVRDQ